MRTQRYCAFIRDEKVGECTWFIYVQAENGHTVYACRFGQRDHAERVAAAMNRAWTAEGRLYEPKFDE